MMALNRTPEEWSYVKPAAVVAGSIAQSQNVLTMAQQDIANLAAANERLQAALQFAIDGYPRIDVNHKDYRVEVYRVALDALAFVRGHNCQGERDAT